MDTTLNPTQTRMHHGLVADADQELARAYEQITRADEELSHAEQQLSRLEKDAASRHRLVRMNRRGQVVRGFTGFLLAALIGITAMVSQSSDDNTARSINAKWVPQYAAFSSPAPENRALPTQPGVATAQAAVDTASQQASPPQASPQPALLAQSAPEGAAPAAAGPSPELTQLLQSMTRDLATLGQGIEQLKAGQEQMARDNANTAEQLKAIQEKMARVVAKTPDKVSDKPSDKPAGQNPRPISAPPPRPIAAPAHKPVPPHPAPQARARPQAPAQSQADDDQ
jgi:prefoldin subunit 5